MSTHPLLGVIPGIHTRKAHQPIKYEGDPRSTPMKAVDAPPVTKSEPPVMPLPAGGAITFTINGELQTVQAGSDLDARTTLASYLRETLNLTGTKIGCNEGGCGACTVMIGRQNPSTSQFESTIANACLRPLFSLDGAHVITTEGLGSSAKGFGPVQRKIAECNGTQCGYCTPGFTLAMTGLLAETLTPTLEEVEARFQGNLCRCTGYRSIYEAMHSFAATDAEGQPTPEAKALCSEAIADIEDLLRKGAQNCHSRKHPEHEEGGCHSKTHGDEKGGCHGKTHGTSRMNPMTANGVTWIETKSLGDAIAEVNECLKRGETYRLVVGSTSTGVIKYYPSVRDKEHNIDWDNPTTFINIARLPELNKVAALSSGAGRIEFGAGQIEFGAAVTLSTIIEVLKASAATLGPAEAGRVALESAVRHLMLVAHYQVRDVASWAGNLILAKSHPYFPSDVALVFGIAGVSLTVISAITGVRTTMNVLDFLDERYALQPDLVVLSATFPIAPEGTVLDSFKVMSRHANSHALVNAAFRLEVHPDGAGTPTIGLATVLVGNISQRPLLCVQTAQSLVGQPVSMASFTNVLSIFSAELAAAMDNGPADGSGHFVVESAEYRQSLAEALLFKFMLAAVVRTYPTLPPDVDRRWLSAAAHYERPISAGQPSFPPLPAGFEAESPLGDPIEKVEGAVQASGEVLYTADLPKPSDTLHAAPAVVGPGDVGKTIVSIDASAATAVPGVFGFIAAEDVASVGASNFVAVGAAMPLGHIFAAGVTEYVGQFVGLVLANKFDVANRAAKLVVVHYSAEAPDVSHKGYHVPTMAYTKVAGPEHGLPVRAPPTGQPLADVSGTISTTGQKHFFLETQVTFAVPGADGQLTVQCASQAIQALKKTVATTLNKDLAKVTVTTTQIGGAYGGKAFLPVSVACAVSVAAIKVNRPVLCQLDRNIDMLSLGGRAPASADFSLSIDTGSKKLSSLVLTATVDCGCNSSGSVNTTSLNCYVVPGARLSKKNLITPTPVNTIMRAPGDFQGAFFMEGAMEAAARTCLLQNVLPLDDARPVQEANLDPGCADVWAKCKALGDAFLADARSFNAANRWRKRGVWTMAVKYSLSNQGYGQQATVTVHSDGSIALIHTGLEMGQGLNTKAVQSVAFELGSGLLAAPETLLPLVTTVRPTTTDGHTATTQTNTWGSGTSESVVFACLEACKTLKARLMPYKGAGDWRAICAAAAAAGVQLSETATKRQNIDGGSYLQYSSAICVAEIDVLSGEVELLRTDMFYDSGVALNPVIDIGQIEGSFVQGMGCLLTEELVRSPNDHRLVNNGTWDYKIPCPLDVPQTFNVSLMPNDINTAQGAVQGSKASGEPAYLLGAAAFFAVKMAIYAARAEANVPNPNGYFELQAPATPARVREACLVSLGERAATAGALVSTVTMGQPVRSGAKPAQSRAPNKVHVDAQVPPLPPAGELLRRRPKAQPTSFRQGDELLEPMSTSKVAAAAEAALLGRKAALVIGAVVLFALGALTGAVVGRTATS